MMLVAHATFGCCLHHEHSCATGCCDSPTPIASECPCHEHEDHGGKPGSTESSELATQTSEHGPHQCGGENCQFTVERKTLEFKQLASLAALDSTSLNLAANNKPDTRDLSPDLHEAAQGPRLHLCLAVLII